ncbi:DUF4115 domain-containing protein [Granulosicoccaceae sp. 1_MG-2023]|nr:DUF4115 domain-containing protein [Granulosicoccaceae sp. 1_MG-2023]
MTESETPDLSAAPGAVLAAERESQGLSRQEICDQLNFTETVLAKLEADDYAALPPPAFVKGYIRSYARYLEIDPEPLIARFNEANADAPEPAVSTGVVPPEARSSDPLMRIATVAVAVVLVLALVYWWLGNNRGSVVDSVLPEETPQSTPSDAGAPAGDDSDFPPDSELFRDSAGTATETEQATVSAAPLQSAEAAVAAPAAVVATSVNQAADQSAPATPVQAVAQDTAEAADAPADAGAPAPKLSDVAAAAADVAGNVLLLQATEASWVSVIDAQQQRLMYGMLTSGTPRKLEGVPPFDIILGVGDGISINYNGEAVDFSSHLRSNRTARFVLAADGSTSKLP